MKWDPYLIPLTKVNLKGIKDLNIRLETSLVMFDKKNQKYAVGVNTVPSHLSQKLIPHGLKT